MAKGQTVVAATGLGLSASCLAFRLRRCRFFPSRISGGNANPDCLSRRWNVVYRDKRSAAGVAGRNSNGFRRDSRGTQIDGGKGKVGERGSVLARSWFLIRRGQGRLASWESNCVVRTAGRKGYTNRGLFE